MYTITPLPVWSHFETFSLTCMHDGLWVLLVRTSPHARCMPGMNPALLGTVIPPARKNPKKHTAHAAHNIIESNVMGPSLRTVKRFCNTWIVTGRRGFCWVPLLTLDLAMPLRTSFRRGNDDIAPWFWHAHEHLSMADGC